MSISEFTGPPVRLQLSRSKGFDLQALSRATNGRRAVNCARPGWAGNPFHHNDDGSLMAPERAGLLFKVQLLGDGWFVNDHGKTIRTADIVKRLGGHNAACFCPVDAPWCHCVPLMLVANAGGGCL